MLYKTDYHIHSTYSDGHADPEEYINRAIASGLSEIGFSDHLTPFRETEHWNMDPENIPHYLKHIETLRDCYKNIRIKTGLEVDFFTGKEEQTGELLSKLPLDYVIGSVHFMGDQTVDLGPEFYDNKNIDQLYESYFELVMAAVSSGLFDIMGHCDLIRIFDHKPSVEIEHLYKKLAKTMKANDVAFEINTNGRNKPVADFYPDRKFLHIFKEENIPVCVNSDAHMPSRVGQYFDEAYELLKNIGFTEMAVFENRTRKMVSF